MLVAAVLAVLLVTAPTPTADQANAVDGTGGLADGTDEANDIVAFGAASGASVVVGALALVSLRCRRLRDQVDRRASAAGSVAGSSDGDSRDRLRCNTHQRSNTRRSVVQSASPTAFDEMLLASTEVKPST